MTLCLLEDLGDDDIALGAHLEVKSCDRFLLKPIIFTFTHIRSIVKVL